MSSPTSRTLQKMRDEGWTSQVVERWNPHARRRIDLFSVIDVIGINETETIGVQATTLSGRTTRLKKILECKEALLWQAAENRRLELWCWRKLKNRWRCHRTEFSVDHTQHKLVVANIDRGLMDERTGRRKQAKKNGDH